jgi:hypothetical protein
MHACITGAEVYTFPEFKLCMRLAKTQPAILRTSTKRIALEHHQYR